MSLYRRSDHPLIPQPAANVFCSIIATVLSLIAINPGTRTDGPSSCRLRVQDADPGSVSPLNHGRKRRYRVMVESPRTAQRKLILARKAGKKSIELLLLFLCQIARIGPQQISDVLDLTFRSPENMKESLDALQVEINLF